MEVLKIEPTNRTLEVVIDFKNEKMVFKGESRPENSQEFFEPIVDFLNEALNNISKNSDYNFDVVFHLDYFNSTSSKYIIEIFKLLKSLSELNNVKMNTKWLSSDVDEDSLESGKDFSEWTGLKVQFVSV